MHYGISTLVCSWGSLGGRGAGAPAANAKGAARWCL